MGRAIILAFINYLYLIDVYIRDRNQAFVIRPSSNMSQWWFARLNRFLEVFTFTPADWLNSPMSPVTTLACKFFHVELYHLLAHLISIIPFLAMLRMSMKSRDIVICFVLGGLLSANFESLVQHLSHSYIGLSGPQCAQALHDIQRRRQKFRGSVQLFDINDIIEWNAINAKQEKLRRECWKCVVQRSTSKIRN